MPEEPPIVETATEARGGSRVGPNYIVMGVSLVLVIVAFIAVYFYYG